MAKKVSKEEEIFIAYARRLMDRFGLHNWHIEIDNAKSRLGVCRRLTKTLGFSIHLINNTSDEVQRDTVLHEIAHALVVNGKTAHDEKWQAIARKIGADPSATTDVQMLAPSQFKWRGECPTGHQVLRHKLNKRFLIAYCPYCPPVQDRQQIQIAWYDRGELVVAPQWMKNPSTTAAV